MKIGNRIVQKRIKTSRRSIPTIECLRNSNCASFPNIICSPWEKHDRYLKHPTPDRRSLERQTWEMATRGEWISAVHELVDLGEVFSKVSVQKRKTFRSFVKTQVKPRRAKWGYRMFCGTRGWIVRFPSKWYQSVAIWKGNGGQFWKNLGCIQCGVILQLQNFV